MDEAQFTDLVEKVFRPKHGKRGYIKAALDELGMSKAQYYRYASGAAPIPQELADRLQAMQQPPKDALPLADVMLALSATALARLERSRESAGVIDTPYPQELRRLMDLLAAGRLLLPEGRVLPQDLASLFAAVARPAALWLAPFGSLSFENEEVVLLNDAGWLSGEAYEMARSSSSDAEESVIFTKLRELCLRQGPRATFVYRAFRELVIRTPVVDGFLKDLVDDHPVLADVPGVAELLMQLYRPFAAVRGNHRSVPICLTSGLPLTAREDGTFATECPLPAAIELARDGQCKRFDLDGDARVLKAAFRSFWLFPGLTELKLADRLSAAGHDVDLWPDMDTVDLAIRDVRSGKLWAIDVKDRRSPRRLARDVDITKLGRFGQGYRFAVVVPDYRENASAPYTEVFQTCRTNRGLPAVEILTETRLLAAIGVPAEAGA